MADVLGLLADPRFQGLDPDKQKTVLGKIDPRFKSLDDDQLKRFRDSVLPPMPKPNLDMKEEHPPGFFRSAYEASGIPGVVSSVKDYATKGPPLRQGLNAIAHGNPEELPPPAQDMAPMATGPLETAARQVGEENYTGAAGSLVGGYVVPAVAAKVVPVVGGAIEDAAPAIGRVVKVATRPAVLEKAAETGVAGIVTTHSPWGALWVMRNVKDLAKTIGAEWKKSGIKPGEITVDDVAASLSGKKFESLTGAEQLKVRDILDRIKNPRATAKTATAASPGEPPRPKDWAKTEAEKAAPPRSGPIDHSTIDKYLEEKRATDPNWKRSEPPKSGKPAPESMTHPQSWKREAPPEAAPPPESMTYPQSRRPQAVPPTEPPPESMTYPRSWKPTGTASRNVSVSATSDSKLLDDIAKAQGGKSFARLSPQEQARVQNMADRIQSGTVSGTKSPAASPSDGSPVPPNAQTFKHPAAHTDLMRAIHANANKLGIDSKALSKGAQDIYGKSISHLTYDELLELNEHLLKLKKLPDATPPGG